MAKTTDADTIVVIDDELHNMVWMLDYIESRDKRTKTASNVNEALALINEQIYRAVIIDLNIPVLDPLIGSVASKGNIYRKYPGLYVAYAARNRGYRDRQVIIYSVHKDPAVAEEAAKLMCTYVLKGRPKEIKEELDSVISYDPTA
jgi:CheY-like chemotaxis protein